ncbi:MAG: glycosyltransferase family 4 protein [Desulfobulbaceae bacterium]|jgi:UDP-glucose:(heptosyl)LPS alpha-1,3-glucosyltransferase|nr:glycosyltransferase family 4 protein [Desulfobulbaceae bacterium]
MKLAFLVNNFYPYGGMEKNFLRIIYACIDQGFAVHVFTMSWQGARPEGVEVTIVPTQGWTNHERALSFVRTFQQQFAASSFDLVVGFNRMPGLDLYYNADVCYVLDMARRRSFLSKLTPRYWVYATFEKAVFAQDSKTHIMYLSEAEKAKYMQVYGTPEGRFHYLPPGIDKERIRKEQTTLTRKQVREEYGVAGDDFFLLMIGSDFGRKGVSRSIKALASLPCAVKKKTRLFVIGQGKEKRYGRQARRLGVTGQVHFLGGRADVPRFFAGADLLLHPAVSENTGNVIVEAMVAGCAVLATEVCGYGFHVEKAQAGCLLVEPFVQQDMNLRLVEMLQSDRLHCWGQKGFAYADRVDLYSRPQAALEIIESLVAHKQAGGAS